jgi:hypothetical protein
MNDHDLLKKIIKILIACIKGKITSKECNDKITSIFNTYKKQLNIVIINYIQNRIDELTIKQNNINIQKDADRTGSNVYFLQRDIRDYNIKINELKSILKYYINYDK